VREFTALEKSMVDRLFGYFSSEAYQRTADNVALLYCYLFIRSDMKMGDLPECYDRALINQLDFSQTAACVGLYSILMSKRVGLQDGQLTDVGGFIVRTAFEAASLRQAESHRDSTVAKARKAVNAKHGAPGGSRSKRDAIRDIWASGKYDSRDRCAEEECGALDISFSTARKALRNTPEPGLADA